MATTYVKLKGLAQEAVYIDNASGRAYTGAALMAAGLPLPLAKTEYEAYQIALTEVEAAKNLYEVLQKHVDGKEGRTVISIFGCSGCGKTTISAIISEYFQKDEVGCYVLSGDNYPIRIPEHNDAERLRIYEESGLEGLTNYLGTPNEIAFDRINDVIAAFKAGENVITLRKMGRKAGEISDEKVDFSGVSILLIEWTHGGSEFLSGVDLPIYIDSTPESTLENRIKRNRDKNAGSELIKTVLRIEQQKLQKQAEHAKIVLTEKGQIYEK